MNGTNAETQGEPTLDDSEALDLIGSQLLESINAMSFEEDGPSFRNKKIDSRKQSSFNGKTVQNGAAASTSKQNLPKSQNQQIGDVNFEEIYPKLAFFNLSKPKGKSSKQNKISNSAKSVAKQTRKNGKQNISANGSHSNKKTENSVWDKAISSKIKANNMKSKNLNIKKKTRTTEKNYFAEKKKRIKNVKTESVENDRKNGKILKFLPKWKYLKEKTLKNVQNTKTASKDKNFSEKQNFEKIGQKKNFNNFS
ncbi:hypothetical protein MHBO_002175, partial [Bonamia ostreae]